MRHKTCGTCGYWMVVEGKPTYQCFVYKAGDLVSQQYQDRGPDEYCDNWTEDGRTGIDKETISEHKRRLPVSQQPFCWW